MKEKEEIFPIQIMLAVKKTLLQPLSVVRVN